MKILALHTNTGSRFYRIVPQLKWMQRHGHKVRLEKHDAPHIVQALEWCDVVIFQLVFSHELIDLAKRMGKTVIFECDDLMHKTHEKHYAYNETRGLRNQLRWWWRIFRVLRKCDGFIVSNDRLKRVYGWMCQRTFVFPNYMELEHWIKEPRKNPTNRVRVLWAGSTSHTGDLHWVKPIMQEIMRRYPQVQFIYIGHGGVPTDDLYARFVYGDDIFEGLPNERRESLLAAPPNVYPYVLASLMADIAIAPLEKNYFNSFKTQCKYLEYAINGIPVVYSKWFYTDVKSIPAPIPIDEQGRYTGRPATGILADTHDEWIGALSLLIENATIRAQIGENARKEVIERYDFAKYAPRWQGFVERVAHECHNSTKPRIS